MGTMFKYSKDMYLETIASRIDKQLKMYMTIRSTIKQAAPDKAEKLSKQYKELREKISVTKDVIPHPLKDVFELFVDSHFKKSLLSQRRLIDEGQKRLIRQAVLKCCAFCGPDSEFEPSKITTRFLDFAKIINDEEYEHEGLLICIKWYMSILEDNKKQSKKDHETAKKLKGILEDLEKGLRE